MISYIKLRKPTIIITLLHIVLMVIFFYLNISTLLYSNLFLGFAVFVISQMVRFNSSNLSKSNKTVGVMIIVSLSVLYFLIMNQVKNIYFNYIWAALIVIVGGYALTKTIKNNNKSTSSEKNKDYFLFYLLVATFIFTLFIDRKSTRLNSSHVKISYAGFCLKQKTYVYI